MTSSSTEEKNDENENSQNDELINIEKIVKSNLIMSVM